MINSVDGVSLTYGTNPRKHIWTFSAAISRTLIHQYVVCPCTHPPNTASITVPPFIGSDYFCDAGTDQWIDNSVFYPEDDPLWDGQGCPSTSTCCQFNSPPWFCRTLPEPTIEDIELRLMADQGYNNEDVPLQLIEIFIQWDFLAGANKLVLIRCILWCFCTLCTQCCITISCHWFMIGFYLQF